jgi:hypothetical protein
MDAVLDDGEVLSGIESVDSRMCVVNGVNQVGDKVVFASANDSSFVPWKLHFGPVALGHPTLGASRLKNQWGSHLYGSGRLTA